MLRHEGTAGEGVEGRVDLTQDQLVGARGDGLDARGGDHDVDRVVAGGHPSRRRLGEDLPAPLLQHGAVPTHGARRLGQLQQFPPAFLEFAHHLVNGRSFAVDQRVPVEHDLGQLYHRGA